MIQIAVGTLFLVLLLLLLTGMVVIARALLMPEQPARLTINGQTEVAAVTGRKLLATLNDNGVLIPSACAGAGTCGLCRVKVVSGGPQSLPIEAARFTPAELRDGLHLACQVVLRGDMSVEVPEDLLGAESFTCEVRSTRQLTPLIREVTLQLPERLRPEVEAGSFVQLTAPPFSLDYSDIDVPPAFAAHWQSLRALSVRSDAEVTRAYSVSNRPEDTAAGRLVLNIRLALPPPTVEDAPPGIVSSWLFSLRDGDPVQTSGPFGAFRVQKTGREMVFIGGGVGIAPLRAMIFDQLERVGTSRKISFWYGARNMDDLLYDEELDALAARHDNFDWTVALSDPDAAGGWSGATGFVHAVAFERYLATHPAPEDCEYYLCGPPLMIRAVLAMLDDLGVDNTAIFNDDFGV
ncbi:MAG: NADH:ubiquinone reductase (Na(+)-transporting) subunit F [Rhodobacteraceae bacterium]|nr:NADH:ubiquinone reductase (Na(+)-transporting) subunit F [Paracoccaceae bacterium]